MQARGLDHSRPVPADIDSLEEIRSMDILSKLAYAKLRSAAKVKKLLENQIDVVKTPLPLRRGCRGCNVEDIIRFFALSDDFFKKYVIEKGEYAKSKGKFSIGFNIHSEYKRLADKLGFKANPNIYLLRLGVEDLRLVVVPRDGEYIPIIEKVSPYSYKLTPEASRTPRPMEYLSGS